MGVVFTILPNKMTRRVRKQHKTIAVNANKYGLNIGNIGIINNANGKDNSNDKSLGIIKELPYFLVR